jgi:predicted transcriptional regulator
MLIKNEVLKSIQELPDEFSFDEAIDTLLLLDKIETGLKQSQDGEILGTAEAKEKLSKWFVC